MPSRPRPVRPQSRLGERHIALTVVLLGLPNLAGAVLVFFFQNVLVPAPNANRLLHLEVVTFLVYVAISFPAAGALAYAMLRPVRRWLADDRPPTHAEVHATLSAPRRMGALGFAFWIGALVVFGAVAIVEREDMREIGRDAVATLLGGLTTAVLAFLLVETWLRPVVAAALEGRAPPRSRVAGIAPRILLSWALGSGVPLLAIAMAQLRVSPAIPRASEEALLFLAIIGIGTGALMLSLAARSVAAPIAAVRSALARVQQGDTDVWIEVDDAGEVGQLQAGFNEMVAGLRERRHLEDLFGRYVGTEVAAAALARGTGLGGEQREITALFVDVVRSTELAHDHSPDEVVAVLNDFFAAVVRVTTTHGGWVNKFEGDGALCVFGAPADQTDHATRALNAARELRVALSTGRDGHDPIDAGIGLSTGVAVAGNVGAVERFEYTVIGDPVNEAARLTDAAKDTAGRVLASGATLTRADADERSRWRPRGSIHLRGRLDVTEVWEPEGV